jgi:hypothetical protein
MFSWDCNKSHIAWPRHYAALLEYGRIHGHCNVPTNDDIFECVLPGLGDFGGIFHYKDRLGRWTKKQRSLYHGSRGEGGLTPERRALLQALVDEGN